MSLLTMQGITRRYPGNQEDAIQDIDLALAPGQALALVGESGSGKTTLLRCIAGFEVPDRGEMTCQETRWVDDRTFVPPEKRKVGMLFQDYALFPHLTVADNIAFGLSKAQRRERKDVVKRLLERVRLGGYGARYPHQLSGGQRQRVALARALAPEPRLLLLDEPFSHLDALVKTEVRDELYALLGEMGIATISVMHDIQDALRCADEIALLYKGRMLQRASAETIYRQPVNAYVACFFGQANLLPVSSEQDTLLTPWGGIKRPEHLKPPTEQEGWLCLRPEMCEVLEDHAQDTASSSTYLQFSATLQGESFLGAQRELRLQAVPTSPGPSWSEDQPLALLAHVAPQQQLSPGAPLLVRIPLHVLQWLPKDHHALS